MLLSETCQVRVCLTSAARHFVFKVSKTYDPEAWDGADGWQQCLAQPDWRALYLDEDEWVYGELGDPVLHIELRKWADAMVIAPASANTLGKLANGLCDNLVTCIARAWDPTLPMLLCPAMNTHMWNHPLTERHLRTLREVCGYRVLDPAAKRLACGDVGKGAMAPIDEIVAAVSGALAELKGQFKWRNQEHLLAEAQVLGWSRARGAGFIRGRSTRRTVRAGREIRATLPSDLAALQNRKGGHGSR